MLGHLRASLLLLLLTLVLCSFLYPLLLWAVGRAACRSQADGSLLRDRGGNVVGSRLIGQDFKGAHYFQPRPSAAGDKPYNAAASGATNWGASHYLLRDRVARQLGPMVKYRNGQPVGPDIETWFQQQPADFVAQWARSHSGLVEQWVKDNPQVVAQWLKNDEDEVKPRRPARPSLKASPRPILANGPLSKTSQPGTSSRRTRATTSGPTSSTCGGRRTLNPTCSRSPPTW
jgi:K+-transporting ATPase ATPase C chain